MMASGKTRWWRCLAAVGVLLVCSDGWAGLRLGAQDRHQYPKLAPFTGVRWRGDVPEVEVDETWYELIALNDLEIAKIIDFAKETYGQRWKKRIGEDLVEVLSKMEQPPGETVALRLRRLDNREELTLPEVPMTRENRRKVWEANRQEEQRERGR
jgi:serine/threonine-protein kinase